jgi:hypothetical protein
MYIEKDRQTDRDREREREKEKVRETESFLLYKNSSIAWV